MRTLHSAAVCKGLRPQTVRAYLRATQITSTRATCEGSRHAARRTRNIVHTYHLIYSNARQQIDLSDAEYVRREIQTIQEVGGNDAPGSDAQALADAFGAMCLRKAIDGGGLVPLRQAIGAALKDGAGEPTTLAEAQALATRLTAQLLPPTAVAAA